MYLLKADSFLIVKNHHQSQARMKYKLNFKERERATILPIQITQYFMYAFVYIFVCFH